MDTIKTYTTDETTVIFGAVVEENAGDQLRVTLVATGIGGQPATRQQPKHLQIVKTGTDNGPVSRWDLYDTPAVMRFSTVVAITSSLVSAMQPWRKPARRAEPRNAGHPAFLRKRNRLKPGR